MGYKKIGKKGRNQAGGIAEDETEQGRTRATICECMRQETEDRQRRED